MSWTTTTIDKNDAVWPKNVHVELAEAIHRGDSKGKRETKEHEGGGVGISNGADFGGPGHVRLNFGCPRERLREILRRMKAVVARAPGRRV